MATDMNYREPGWAFSNTPRYLDGQNECSPRKPEIQGQIQNEMKIILFKVLAGKIKQM